MTNPSSKHESPLRQYFRIRPVIEDGEPDAQRIEFHVGNQTFNFGPEYCESKEHAEWFVSMAIKAMHNAFKGMCNKCDGHGYVDEGDEENGPMPTSCDECGGKGKTSSVETNGIPWQEKAEKRADKIHELRATLAGMIEAVRAVNIERKDWYAYVAIPLQNAYQALGIEGVKMTADEIAALGGSSVEPSPVLVRNGYCTDCGGINEHYDHCLTKTAGHRHTADPVNLSLCMGCGAAMPPENGSPVISENKP